MGEKSIGGGRRAVGTGRGSQVQASQKQRCIQRSRRSENLETWDSDIAFMTGELAIWIALLSAAAAGSVAGPLLMATLRCRHRNSNGPVLVRVCAWCQSFIGLTAAEGLDRTTLTHGVCRRCAQRWRAGRACSSGKKRVLRQVLSSMIGLGRTRRARPSLRT